MTHKQENYLSMSQTVISILYENEATWSGNAPITGTIEGINAINGQIIDLQAQQLITSKGITTRKKNCRNTVQNSLLAISSILSFYAAAAGKTELQEQMNLDKRTLQRASGLKLIGISEMVSDAGADNLAGAAVYGLTQTVLDNLGNSGKEFTKLLNAPRNARAAKAKATAAIALLMAALRTEIEDKLDKAMVLYISIKFYNLYTKARIIVHSSPTHHLALMVAITGSNGKPLAGARVTIANGNDKVLRKTSPLGNIRVQHLHDGSHTMTIEKEGCETQVVSFIVSPPATTRLQIVMKE